MQTTYLEKSLELASYVQDQFRVGANRTDRGVKQAGFLVLWQASMPSILIETGFISNAEEEAFLISKQGQEYLASAIYRAVKAYINNIEKDDVSEIVETNMKKISLINDSTPKATKNKTEVNQNVWFRVQVTSSSKPIPLNNSIFKNYTDVYEYYEKSMYKYTVGKYKLYNETKVFFEKVKKDFPGAFIVAFDNNERINLTKAIEPIN